MREFEGGLERDTETCRGDERAGQAIPERGAVLNCVQPYFSNDQWAKADPLNVQAQARIFAKLIAARNVAMPLSVGVFGNSGSGKTFFMESIRQEIAYLAMSEDPKDYSSTYMRRVAQIEFNAWHYVDTNLWTSLAIRIFDGLADEFPLRAGDTRADLRARLRAKMESSREARIEAEKKQQEAQQELVQALLRLGEFNTQRNRLVEIKKLAAELGFLVNTAEDAANAIDRMKSLGSHTSAFIQTIFNLFASWQSVLIFFGLICGFMGILLPIIIIYPSIWTYLGQIITVAGGAVLWIRKRLAQNSKRVSQLEMLVSGLGMPRTDRSKNGLDAALEKKALEKRNRQDIAELDARISTAEAQIAEAGRRIAEAEAAIQRIDAGGLVYDSLGEPGADSEYQKEFGFISTIRRDFNGLSSLLRNWNKNNEGDSELPPIERIVLYIDDLDRCHPDRVVEVLQAVHLLLAFELFAVVIAADLRWLVHSLDRVYVSDLAVMDVREIKERERRGFSAQNYLEKIFQIPFSLAAMSSDGYAKLIDGLFVTRSEFQVTSETPGPASPLITESAGIRESPPVDGEPRETRKAVRGVADMGEQAPAARDAPVGPQDKAPPRKPSSDEEVLFNDWERAFLQAMYPFAPTPRLAKRLINIYRMIRVHALETPWRDGFFAPDGDYRAVLVLLALDIGHPQVGAPVLRQLKSEKEIKSFRAFLEFADRSDSVTTGQYEPAKRLRETIAQSLKNESASADEFVLVREKMTRVQQALGEWSRDHPSEIALSVPDEIETYARWAPEVGRFSFHWNLE